MSADFPDLSAYALCQPEDVADLLGYDDDQLADRVRTITRTINSASVEIRRRAQREFVQTDVEKARKRWLKIDESSLTTRTVRLGDFSAVPTQVRLYTPDRDDFVEVAVDENIDNSDVWVVPDDPEPGWPFEYLYFKSTVSLTPGWWVACTTDWGFPEIPDNIIQVAIGTAAEWILNDVMKLSELARQQGRQLRLSSLIPEQYADVVDSFRIYRVS